MCIIIDACCANSLGDGKLPQARLILDWVKAGGKIVSGGKLEQELKGTALQPLLAAWSSAGRLISFEKGPLEIEEKLLDKTATKSNDYHVLALARVSGAKVVVTRDKPLMYDLKKSGQVAPARSIYPFPDFPAQNLTPQRGVLRNAGCK